MKIVKIILGRIAKKSGYYHALRKLVVGVSLISLPFISGQLSAAVPGLTAVYLGGTPTGINNVGQVVGFDASGTNSAWVYTPGVGKVSLPAPSGWSSTALNINDNGVIVGSVDNGISGDSADGATVWRLTATGYEMTLINTPDTDRGSVAIAINSQGDIAGSRTFLAEISAGRFTTVTRGFLLKSDGVLVEDLSVLGFNTIPTDINDNRQLVGGAYRMNINTGVVEDLSTQAVTDGQTFFNTVYSYGINELGQVAASAVVATGGRVATRFTDAIGWDVLTPLPGTSNSAYSINDSGDVLMYVNMACNASSAPVVNLGNDGTFCLQQLISDQNWQIASSFIVTGLNNNRDAISIAQNVATGEFGGVLLKVSGDLPPPSAPADLVAVPHIATSVQPFIAIDLSWTDTSDNEFGFRIERSPAGSGSWLKIGSVAANTFGFRDLQIDPLLTYDYRVFAEGAGGDAVSNIATATAPAAVDTLAPVVTIDSPFATDVLSGNFDISVTASDNVAVSLVVIEMQINGAWTNICNVVEPLTAQFSCAVNARKLKLSGNMDLPINVTAYDAMSNSAGSSVTVSWQGGGSSKGGGKGQK